ncbi:hypothetical protein BH09MYX1_BH09MYX1_56610 [soil metagenome]
MTKTYLGLVAVALLASACGGEDTVSIPDPDAGGNDTGTNNDASTTTDGGTDGNTTTDGATDGATTTDGGIFQVGSVTGLVLWLNAGKGVNVNNGVDAWADQTSFKNDAKQTIQGRRPTLASSAINSLPAVHFDKGGSGNSNGQMVVIPDSVSMQWGTGDFFVVLVARYDNAVTDGNSRGVGVLFSKVAQANTFAGPALYGNIPSLTVSNPTVGLDFSTQVTAGNYVVSANAYNNGNPHAFAIQRVGTKLDLRVDSASIATSTGTGVDVSTVGTPTRIGADADATNFRLNGDVAEVIAVKGALSSNDQNGIQSYLKSKYALP